ncbi:MAG: hypothetical protein ACLUHE_08200 [Christensenellales bacterium]
MFWWVLNAERQTALSRAFFVVQVKEKRQAVSSGRLNGGVGVRGRRLGAAMKTTKNQGIIKKTRHKAREKTDWKSRNK